MKTLARLALAASLVVLPACSSDSFEETGLVGSYHATTLTTASASEGTIDYVARGGTVTLTLESNGETSGRLFVPDAGAGDTDLDVELGGHWEFNSGIVILTLDESSFLQTMSLTPIEDRLEGQQDFGGTVVHVVFQRAS